MQDGSRPLSDVIADPRQEPGSERLDQGILQRRLDEIFADLDIRERQVLRMRYGLQGEQPLSLGDIGRFLRVSKERIRQIEESAMGKLRQPQRAARFVEFFHESRERLMNDAASLQACSDLCGPHFAKRQAKRRV